MPVNHNRHNSGAVVIISLMNLAEEKFASPSIPFPTIKQKFLIQKLIYNHFRKIYICTQIVRYYSLCYALCPDLATEGRGLTQGFQLCHM